MRWAPVEQVGTMTATVTGPVAHTVAPPTITGTACDSGLVHTLVRRLAPAGGLPVAPAVDLVQTVARGPGQQRTGEMCRCGMPAGCAGDVPTNVPTNVPTHVSDATDVPTNVPTDARAHACMPTG